MNKEAYLTWNHTNSGIHNKNRDKSEMAAAGGEGWGRGADKGVLHNSYQLMDTEIFIYGAASRDETQTRFRKNSSE